MTARGTGSAKSAEQDAETTDFALLVGAAQEKLRTAGGHPAIRSDPTKLWLGGISASLDAMHKMMLRMEHLAGVASERGISPDAEKAYLDRLGQSADRIMRIHAVQYLRVGSLRNVLIASGVLLAVAAACLGGGYWWGHRSARAEIADTEAGLRAAFAAGPAEAALWLRRMELNPFKLPCHEHVENGRRVCDTSLWMDPPRN